MDLRLRWILLLVVALFACVAPASADQWYEHYARAEKALLDNDYSTAVTELNLAIERRGDSGARVRTYGMRVTDYFPYLKLGIAYFAAGEYEAALRAFETEEQLGAVQGSQSASDELGRFRSRAAQALEKRRSEQQRAVVELVEENLVEARNLRDIDRMDEAMAAVDRALALAPDNADANGLAEALREEIIRRNDERGRTERVSNLVSAGESLRAQGRLTEAAASFRQAAELEPGSDAVRLLAEVQAELARSSEDVPIEDWTAILTRADELMSHGELESALGLVQQVLAAEPGNPRAAGLEGRIMAGIADGEVRGEIRRNLNTAEGRFAHGNLEGAIASANLVLARDQGNTEALGLIQRAYASLSRRLLGAGPAQNLPPAIRFADSREATAEGSLVQVVRESGFRLSGVVIDDTGVELVVTMDEGTPVAIDHTSQEVGRVVISEFRLRTDLPVGTSRIEVVATDVGGLSSRSEYTVEFRRPLLRSPRFWITVFGLALLAAAGLAGRRVLRRRRLLRRRFNPYVAGPPVFDPELFIGRDDLVDRVLATVPNNSLLLLGERRIGKTSMLHQLSLQLPKLDHPRFCFVPVSIDLQGVPEEAFFATVAEAVGEAVGDERMSAAGVEDGYDSRELTRDLRRVLPALECPDERLAKLVLLLDEIDELNGYSHRTNQRLRSLFMRGFADQLVAVAAGVGIAREWDHEGSPWYNFFEELEVGPIDATAARGLATRPLGGVIAIDDDAVERLLDEADGRPYILQKIALAAVQRVHDEGRSRITLGDVAASAMSP